MGICASRNNGKINKEMSGVRCFAGETYVGVIYISGLNNEDHYLSQK